MPVSSVILVGAPRSGTTWLQRMLGAHPAIATAQETDFWDGYICPWVALWERQLSNPHNPRNKGLPAVLTTEEFHTLVREVASSVYMKIASLKPTAAIVLDKNPTYALHTAMISGMLPASRFIHIIRDGRDVASSLVAAKQSWGGAWAPSSIEQAAYRWSYHVNSVRSAELPPHRYLEVRYEGLLADTSTELRRCLEFCGVPATESLCDDLAENFRFDRLTAAASAVADPLLWSGEVMARSATMPKEPAGFYREGQHGGWRREWGPSERWSFDRMAGQLLVTLGYEPDRTWARIPLPVRATLGSMRVARAGLRRVRRRLLASP